MEQGYHAAKMLIKRCEWKTAQMLFRRIGRFVFTFSFYFIEVVLLLNMVELLFGDYDIKPITWIMNVKLGNWIVSRGPGTFLQTHIPSKQINELLLKMLNAKNKSPEAVGAVIGAVGVGGVFIAWLTGAAERLVCGVRTGELLGWIHKFFFSTYAAIFLPLVFGGVFAGYSRNWEASIYALIGVFLGLIYTLWVCFELVLIAKSREKMAMQYYFHLVRPRLALWWERYIKWRKGEKEDLSYYPENTRRAMLSVADYLKNQAQQYHQNFSKEMIELWQDSCWIPFGEDKSFHISCFKPDDSTNIIHKIDIIGGREKLPYKITIDKDGQPWFEMGTNENNVEANLSFHYPVAYISGKQDYVIAHILFSKDIWTELLSGEIITEQDLTIIRQLLCRLGQVAKDKRYITILLGLLFCLTDKGIDEIEQIKWVNKMTQGDYASTFGERVSQEVRADLVWALLMIFVVAWIKNGRINGHGKTLYLFSQCFSEELNVFIRESHDNKSLNVDARQVQNKENNLLWYAEWAARLHHSLSLERYLLGLNKMVYIRNYFFHVPFEDFSYRKKLLMNLFGKPYMLDIDNEEETERIW